MQILSYINYENVADKSLNSVTDVGRKSLLRKATSLSLGTSDTVGKSINIGLAAKYNSALEKHKRNIVPYLVFSLLVFSFLVTVGLGVFIFASKFKSPLSTISLETSAEAQEELSKYLFPADETYSVEIGSLLNSVSFQEVSYKTYTVKSGDTISGIAYSFGLRSMGTIIALNDIENVKRLQVGTKLTIPSVDGLLHRVKKGETLAGIASKYGLTLNNLLDTNNLASDVINIGDSIFIPGARLSNFELKKALGELFIFPMTGRLTSPFGYRKDPFTGQKSFHNGIDLANSLGTPVKNIMDGKVSEVGYNNVYGNYIIITHDGGYQSMYGHLSAMFVKRGAYVAQGTRIGSVGSTGRSTGPHLHLSIYKNGQVIDPLSVLEKQ